MTDEINLFGGKNPNGIYVPLTDIEQEVLSRLVEADDLEVVIHGWGILHKPKVQFGDLRLSITFRLTFNRPEVPMPVHFLDLELRTRAGLCLFRERQPTIYNGQPLQAAAGVFVDMVWDIALSHIDPKVVKALKPGAIGLTSRRLDKDTGDKTLRGNMRLTPLQKRHLQAMAEGEKETKAADLKKMVDATEGSGGTIKKTGKGLEVGEVR